VVRQAGFFKNRVVKRSDLIAVIGLVEKHNPKAFYSIEDVRAVREGIFVLKSTFYGRKYLRMERKRRKGK